MPGRLQGVCGPSPPTWLDLQQQAEKGGMACVSLGICFHRYAGLAHIARISTCPPPLRQDLPSLPPPHLHPLRLAADLPHLTTTTTHMLVNSWPHGVMPSPWLPPSPVLIQPYYATRPPHALLYIYHNPAPTPIGRQARVGVPAGKGCRCTTAYVHTLPSTHTEEG